MSRLRIFAENNAATPELIHDEHAAIAEGLGKIGVRFERWETRHSLKPGASQDEVFAAYREDIDRLVNEYGFKSVDVVSIAPDHPQREELRAKFLDEHTHQEDEVRFFVAGTGLFFLHVGDKVMQIENDYDKEVYNGDLGVVRAIAVEDETMSVEFDGRLVTYDFGDLDRLVLRALAYLLLGHGDVAQHVHVREEIELLEHHADP